MTKRIIVPLDGSPLSHAALPLARGLSRQIGAPVTLTSVVDPPSDMFFVAQDATQSRMRPRDIERLSDENARLEAYLEQVRSTFESGPVATAVRVGRPAEQILELAEETSEPIVVIASHGRSGLGRALLGSVATRVVQGARFPVFIVRASDDSKAEHGKTEIELVVVPLDGSLIARQALATVRRLFGNTVRLHLIRAVEPVSPGQAYAPDTLAEYERSARTNAEAHLRETAEQLEMEGYTVTWEVRGAAPAAGITEVADRLDADLIAMTTHGRSGLGRFMLGSVAERVLHDAQRPVMMVRAAESDRNDSDAPPLV